MGEMTDTHETYQVFFQYKDMISSYNDSYSKNKTVMTVKFLYWEFLYL